MWLTFFHIMETLVIILDSSMVEHSAVNRVVVGSSPTRGVFLSDTLDTPSGDNTRLHGQAVKTSPFHGGNTGSIPVGVIENGNVCADVAQLAEQLICNQQVDGSTPFTSSTWGISRVAKGGRL